MNTTTIRTIKFDKLSRNKNSAATVVRLMMCCNDMQLANEALHEWKQTQSRNKKYRQQGAKMYFCRLQISHLLEGFDIIDSIKKDSELMNLLDRCDKKTQESFEYVEKLKASKKVLLTRIRSNLTFHYNEDGKLIARAISEHAASEKFSISSITRGSSAYLWHFKLSDDIIDHILIRQIFGISENSDSAAEADKIMDDIHQIFLRYTDFAGEFIWKFSEK